MLLARWAAHPEFKRRMGSRSTGSTGTPDITYNLVSVLYHALQGAENYQKYMHDADTAGSQEFSQFFRECYEEEKRRADRARDMLTRHFQQSSGTQRRAA